MAATVKSIRVNQSVRWNWEGAGTPPNKNVAEFSKSTNYITGTASGTKVNRLYRSVLTISGSSTTTLDLTSLTDPESSTITFDKVRCIYVENNTLTASTAVTVGGGSSPTLTNTSNPIGNGGALVINEPTLAGIPVGASTKNLRFINSDTATANVRVVIGGEDT